jgi:membrane protein YdbS with pleckstrin-like domain
MRYPKRLLTDDEEILRQFRPHWRVLLPTVGWALLLAALAAVAIVLAGEQFTTTAGGVAFGLWLLLSARRLFNWWFTSYVLTTERIIVRRGWIARSGTEIPLESINNVLFSQRVIERLLGYGDILIESAGQQGQSRIEDIPRPEAFQAEVYAAREMRALHFSGGVARDIVAQLESLAGLRERGHITDAEFEAKKRRLLGDAAPAAEWPEDDEVPYEP